MGSVIPNVLLLTEAANPYDVATMALLRITVRCELFAVVRKLLKDVLAAFKVIKELLKS